jgi:hypothetical protein
LIFRADNGPVDEGIANSAAACAIRDLLVARAP